MPKREMRLVPTQPVVRRHHGHALLASGAPGETGGARALAARASSALWWVSGATQPPAQRDHAHTAPAGDGRGGAEEGHPVLDLGAALGAGVSSGDGYLSL